MSLAAFRRWAGGLNQHAFRPSRRKKRLPSVEDAIGQIHGFLIQSVGDIQQVGTIGSSQISAFDPLVDERPQILWNHKSFAPGHADQLQATITQPEKSFVDLHPDPARENKNRRPGGVRRAGAIHTGRRRGPWSGEGRGRRCLRNDTTTVVRHSPDRRGNGGQEYLLPRQRQLRCDRSCRQGEICTVFRIARLFSVSESRPFRLRAAVDFLPGLKAVDLCQLKKTAGCPAVPDIAIRSFVTQREPESRAPAPLRSSRRPGSAHPALYPAHRRMCSD